MRWIKRFIYISGSIVLLAAIATLIYLASLKPQYSGSLQLKGLISPTEVLFDSYGIPHIYAKNEEDAYAALGFVQAQERLFQMEMIRRVATGRLSEVFGHDFVPIDKFFKTLCIQDHALASARYYMQDSIQTGKKAALAYLNGINQYIESGQTPIEFTLLGFKPEKFSISDLFLTIGYMSFNFAEGFKTDPVMSYIYKKYGDKYLNDINGIYKKSQPVLTSPIPDSTLLSFAPDHFESTAAMLDRVPASPMVGSNAWVVAPEKSKSGKVLFANDAHITYGQPCVWYEAHIEYPGFSSYGNYLAGFPFAVIGHSREITWGLTMFLNDDVDFYSERIKPDDKFKVWDNGAWVPLQVINKKVHVKNEADRECIVRISKHGPLMQGVMPEWKYITSAAVSLSWTHLKFPSNMLQVSYNINHSRSMEDVRNAASQIISPGVNVIYGDSSGNIAWWAAAKLIKRPAHVNTTLLLDGASGKDEFTGYYDFSFNPKSENPASGLIVSANNLPDSSNSVLVPGYYVPDERANRIHQLLTDREKYGPEDFQRINTDVISTASPKLAQYILAVLDQRLVNKTTVHNAVYYKLIRWNGSHLLQEVEPTIYYRLIYYILKYSLSDEMGETNFKTYLQTHAMKNALAPFIENDSSKWWDDITTKNKVERRSAIFNRAFDQTVNDLVTQFDNNVNQWKWGAVHQLEHIHPIGMKKPFNLLFNVGPYPVQGGNETINNSGFDLTNEKKIKVKFGPSMRIVLDFANIENSLSILPTGESGNIMSTNYKNQAPIYNNGKLRGQKMNREEILSKKSGRMLLSPAR